MSKYVLIVENSNAPHESAVVSAVEIFSRMGFGVKLVLNKTSIRRFEGIELGGSIEIVDSSLLRNWPKIISLKAGSAYTLFNTILLRNIISVVLLSLFKSNNIFYVRNVNSWFAPPRKGMVSGLSRLKGVCLYRAKTFLKARATVFALGSYNMKSAFSKSSSAPAVVIPFDLYHPSDEVELDESVFHIVVPGGIDCRRKDLSVIKQAFHKLDVKVLGQIKLTLLGRPATDKDKIFLLEFKRDFSDQLVIFDSFIPANVFDSALKSADIIAGVVKVDYMDKYGSCETYGVTKDTGIEAHAIAYAKPLLINSDYTPDKYLEGMVMKYKDSDEFATLLTELVSGAAEVSRLLIYKCVSNYEAGLLSKKMAECLDGK